MLTKLVQCSILDTNISLQWMHTRPTHFSSFPHKHDGVIAHNPGTVLCLFWQICCIWNTDTAAFFALSRHSSTLRRRFKLKALAIRFTVIPALLVYFHALFTLSRHNAFLWEGIVRTRQLTEPVCLAWTVWYVGLVPALSPVMGR
jgi:hypothetical protein